MSHLKDMGGMFRSVLMRDERTPLLAVEYIEKVLSLLNLYSEMQWVTDSLLCVTTHLHIELSLIVRRNRTISTSGVSRKPPGLKGVNTLRYAITRRLNIVDLHRRRHSRVSRLRFQHKGYNEIKTDSAYESRITSASGAPWRQARLETGEPRIPFEHGGSCCGVVSWKHLYLFWKK